MTSRRAPDARYDVVVVGAGIVGVQIAREAACRGRSVLLVDKGDFGSGTSSATTKYLHGGIRYLEQLDVAVVRESLRERRIATLSAPHLVRQTRFLLPVWSWSHPGRWLLGAGGVLYGALAFDRNRSMPDQLRLGRPRWLGRAAVVGAVPWLDATELRGALAVTETLNVHPERLLLEYLLDAVSLGAAVRNHAAVTGFVTSAADDGAVRVEGVELTDGLGSDVHRVAAGTVVNAAGPWVGDVLDRLVRPDGERRGPTVTPSKGVHVLSVPSRHPAVRRVTDAVMARGRSGRHVVISPWQGRELIGPTDTPVNVAPDDVAADPSDVSALLEIANACRVDAAHLTIADVDDVTVGIRPLVSAHGADTYSASRRHEVFDHRADGVHGLWSVAGGKWTTGRAVAEDVLDRLLDGTHRGLRSHSGSPTRTRSVPGATGWAASPSDVFELASTYRRDLAIDVPVRHHLARLYGVRCTSVLDLVASDPSLGQRISVRHGRLDVGAQVVIAVGDEFARTLSDIVDRRLALGTLGRVERTELERVASIAAPLLGWPDEGRPVAAAEHERRERRRAAWRARPDLGRGYDPDRAATTGANDSTSSGPTMT